VDAFVVYTDNELGQGRRHPFQALSAYRRERNKPNAKLIVAAMTATNFTVADPSDPGMLDIAGFDTAAPAVMAEFVR
jgi:60 kDa SS-A/Ro ribonucleoprotein